MPAKNTDELTAAVADWNRKARAKTRANQKSKEAKAAEKEAEENVKLLLGDRGQDGVKACGSLVSTYPFDHYYVPEALRADFEAWAEDQDEEYLEPNRRVRESDLKSTCQELEQNKQPLPPGVRKYTETKISKRKA